MPASNSTVFILFSIGLLLGGNSYPVVIITPRFKGGKWDYTRLIIAQISLENRGAFRLPSRRPRSFNISWLDQFNIFISKISCLVCQQPPVIHPDG